MLAIIKQFVRRMLMGKGKGILQIPPQKAVDDFANDLFKKFKKNGVSDEAITNPKDVKIVWEQITNREAQIMHTNLKDVLKKSDPFKKEGEIIAVDFDKNKNWFKGKSEGVEDVSFKPGMDPKGKIIIESPSQIIARMKAMTPMDAMAEANSVIGRKGKYKNLTPEESKKILKDTNDHIFERDIKYDEFGEIIKPDPEDLAGGGAAGRTSTGLNYLLGEDDQNSRVPYGGGGIGRRLFLKMMGAGAAGTVAAKSGVLGLLKAGKPTAQVLTSVPIGNASGMPVWFKPLVNKIIKEGDDVTKKLATKDREIVHRAQIDKDASVDVIQDLDTGNVRIEYDAADNLGYGPIQLDYKAGEVIEQGSKRGTKTKPEFSAVESEPRITNWDGDIEFDGENIVNVVDDLMTDTTKLETYATGKKPNIKKLLKSEQKKKYVNKLNDDQMEQLEYIENKQGDIMEQIDEGARVGDFDPKGYRDYETKGINLPEKIKKASGGRVPLGGGLAGMLGE